MMVLQGVPTSYQIRNVTVDSAFEAIEVILEVKLNEINADFEAFKVDLVTLEVSF